METYIDTTFSSAAIGNKIAVLEDIHLQEKNIAVFERSVDEWQTEINRLVESEFQFKEKGTEKEIIDQLKAQLSIAFNTTQLLSDVRFLLKTFRKLSKAKEYQLILTTVSTDMCRRFHTDINYLRMLCTYSGTGTWWLPEIAADRRAHDTRKDNDAIVKTPHLIQQANVGDVLVLKGEMYPNANAIIHRSPEIENKGEKRLLLRIDTNDTLQLFE